MTSQAPEPDSGSDDHLITFLRGSKSPYIAVYSHALEESNEPKLRPRYPPQQETGTNDNRVKLPLHFKATDHTIRRSKSQHHPQVSRLDRRKVNVKVSRQRHLTCWRYKGSRVGQWFNHRHDMCCCTLSIKGPLAIAGKAQNTVCTLYSVEQCGPTKCLY